METRKSLLEEEAAMNALYEKAIEVKERRNANARENNAGPPATEIISELKKALDPIFGHKLLKIDTGARIGPEDSVYIVYASVPKGSPEIDALNAKSSPMISISSAKNEKWFRGQPSPPKLEAAWFRGSLVANRNYKDGLKFRRKTDSPDKIVKYVIDFFLKNKVDLLDNERK